MESEEVYKLVDGVYKNILDKFNPGAKQLIAAGKAYLKALHGAAAAQQVYLEAVVKVAKQAQQSAWHASSPDIGMHLQEVADVQKEVHSLQMNVLKAFYVDLLVPLEANLEKDSKAIQVEQRKFVQSYRQYADSHQRAAAAVRKYGKKHAKGSRSSAVLDKEIKEIQRLDEEKNKLESFCEQSLRNALCQERRRYGFVLERQCSLSRHWLSVHSRAATLLDRNVGAWQESARSRDLLPDSVFGVLNSVGQAADSIIYGRTGGSSSRSTVEDLEIEEHDRYSVVSQLRKSRSLDASTCLDDEDDRFMETRNPSLGNGMSRAHSEYNLLVPEIDSMSRRIRPKSLALDPGSKGIARALYAYLSSGENQLSFLENDTLLLLGDRNKGWQYGENARTGRRGWFPIAYIEQLETDDMDSGIGHQNPSEIHSIVAVSPPPSNCCLSVNNPSDSDLGKVTYSEKVGTIRRLRESHSLQSSEKHRYATEPRCANSTERKTTPSTPLTSSSTLLRSPRTPITSLSSPKTHRTSIPVPPPIPGSLDFSLSSKRNSVASPMTPCRGVSELERKSRKVEKVSTSEEGSSVIGSSVNPARGSLNSSDDSGFGVDGPPPQPETDYNDDDSQRDVSQETIEDPSVTLNSRNWLLYRSALELQEDVERQTFPRQCMTLERPKAKQKNDESSFATLTKRKIPVEKKNEGVRKVLNFLRFIGPLSGNLRKLDDEINEIPAWEHTSEIELAYYKKRGGSSSKPRLPPPVPPMGSTPLAKSSPKFVKKPPPRYVPSSTQLPRRCYKKSNRQDCDAIAENEVNVNLSRNARSEPNLLEPKQIIYLHDLIPPPSLPCSQPHTLPRNNRKMAKVRFHHSSGHIDCPDSALETSPDSCDSSDLTSYGRSLQKRLSRPELDSRFDRESETTGQKCGPWYELWIPEQDNMSFYI